jgi:hypothetical protein
MKYARKIRPKNYRMNVSDNPKNESYSASIMDIFSFGWKNRTKEKAKKARATEN